MTHDAPDPRKARTLIFLDTETTGIAEGRLIQLAYKVRAAHDAGAMKDGGANTDGGAGAMRIDYFKPPVPIEIEAMAVHHITEKHVADKPAFAGSDAHGSLMKLLARPDAIIVAHNALFDIGILDREGVPASAGPFICTMKVAQSMYDLPQYKMQYLRYLWGIEDDDATAHDAAGDVAILERVFDHILADWLADPAHRDADAAAALEAFIATSRNPLLLRRMTFGRYAGKTFAEVAAEDRSYLEWLATLNDKGEDFAYTVRHYLDAR
jgi:DNA polymerase III epsilon subunit-like protein